MSVEVHVSAEFASLSPNLFKYAQLLQNLPAETWQEKEKAGVSEKG